MARNYVPFRILWEYTNKKQKNEKQNFETQEKSLDQSA